MSRAITWARLTIFGMCIVRVALSSCVAAESEDCAKGTFVPYFRIYIDDVGELPAQRIIVDDSPLDKKTTANTILVLQTYRVPFQEKGGDIWIPCETWKDREWMMNLALKAANPEWIKQQRELLDRLERKQK